MRTITAAAVLSFLGLLSPGCDEGGGSGGGGRFGVAPPVPPPAAGPEEAPPGIAGGNPDPAERDSALHVEVKALRTELEALRRQVQAGAAVRPAGGNETAPVEVLARQVAELRDMVTRLAGEARTTPAAPTLPAGVDAGADSTALMRLAAQIAELRAKVADLAFRVGGDEPDFRTE
ncbi:MAG: hypothetical protein MUE73_01200 [Planctomycetes bacterium]|nr:hypothetical protein [Planctomycetota bacterium]